MPSYRITIAYDGTDFVGWQRQASGTSIQGLIEDALFPFEDRPVTVTGAGRTDAGAHAQGQVAAFALERGSDPATLVRAINARLPAAVRVLDAVESPQTFHPRFDAASKTYRYTIWTGAVVSPFTHRYVWHYPGPLDLDAMNTAAAVLVGEHDYASFEATGGDVESTVRVMHESVVAGERNESVIYTVSGNGFLRHMVRAVVGTLVEIGRKRRPLEWMREVLDARDRSQAGPTAPSSGLCLMRVTYRR